MRKASSSSPVPVLETAEQGHVVAEWRVCSARMVSRAGSGYHAAAQGMIKEASRRSEGITYRCPDLGSWSPRKDSNPRPSDYESKRIRPAGASQACPGCSGQRARPSSALLTCRVMAGGMTKGMTTLPRQDYQTVATFRFRSEGRSSPRIHRQTADR